MKSKKIFKGTVYDKMTDLLILELEQGKEGKYFINTQGLRGVGKTWALIMFAKKYDYTVVVPYPSMARSLKEKTGYSKIVSVDYLFDASGWMIENLVIDENVTQQTIIKFIDLGYNVVTGFTSEIEEERKQEEDFNKVLLENIRCEIRDLGQKIVKTRNTWDKVAEYKNLIQAYKDIVQLYQEVKRDLEMTDQEKLISSKINVVSKDVWTGNKTHPVKLPAYMTVKTDYKAITNITHNLGRTPYITIVDEDGYEIIAEIHHSLDFNNVAIEIADTTRNFTITIL